MFWRSRKLIKLISVLPKNYRCILLHAIELATDPKVIMDKQVITDFSEQGKLTRKNILNCINFEILDGDTGILGFHDHPDEMWISGNFQDFAIFCEQQGWLYMQKQAI